MLLGETTVCGELISSLGPSSVKQVRYVCELCQSTFVGTYQSYVRGQQRRKNSGLTYCQPCASHLKSWKGGKPLTADGYQKIQVSRKKYRLEHRLLFEEHLGRSLTNEEIIHHIDGNKLNNRLENLDLCPTKGVHTKAHHSLESLGFLLLKAGYAYYDRNTHTYVAHDKLCELLEHPEEGDQQPSKRSDSFEGSTTSLYDVSDIMKSHERRALKSDDIV